MDSRFTLNSEDMFSSQLNMRRSGFSLDRDFYFLPELFEREVDRLYMRHWLYAGPLCRIPNSGDYFLYQIASESIIVVRTDDGAVSLLVDEIGDVLDVDEATYERPPENLDPAARELIRGVYKLKDRLLLVLDAERTVDLSVSGKA